MRWFAIWREHGFLTDVCFNPKLASQANALSRTANSPNTFCIEFINSANDSETCSFISMSQTRRIVWNSAIWIKGIGLSTSTLEEVLTIDLTEDFNTIHLKGLALMAAHHPNKVASCRQPSPVF
jgi:hypothetical protein